MNNHSTRLVKFLNTILFNIIFSMYLYLFMSFIKSEFNPMMWDYADRGFLATIHFIVTTFSFLLLYNKNK